MRELNDYERRQLAEAAMRTHYALNTFNSAERAARRAKQEYERVQAEEWAIANRIHGCRP